MAEGSTTLLYRFLGIDAGAGAQFDRMAAKTTMLGDSSKSAFTKLKALTVGGAIGVGALAIASIKMASDYQRSMTLIRTQAGATQAEVDSFSKSLLGMAGQVGKSPEELATSLYHVYSTGLRGAEALKAVKIAAEGAQVGNADLEETTNALTSTIASGIKGAGNYSKAMGNLIAIVGSGDMKLSDLNAALGTGVLSAARVFNVSLNQAGAALAVFGDNNIRGADAATKLRMVMQDLAKPAANADETLSQIGLTSADLQSKLENHGLTAALEDLKQHMDQAGITAGKVGPFIENAFTKKAGVGLGILIEQMGRYNQKLEEGAAGAGNFGADWQATTHTLSFALDRLKAEAQAAMIALGTKLLPAATDAADALGRTLPLAVAKLQRILQPFEQIVGNALVFSWKALGGAVKLAGSALSAVGNFIEQHKTAFTVLATAVAGMWLAFKGYMIAKVAISAIGDALLMLRLRASVAADGVRNFANAETSMSAASMASKAAMLGVGIALSIVTYKWMQHQQQVADAKAVTEDYLSVLQQTKGAIDDQVVALTTQKLAESGVYDEMAKNGISLRDTTQAALGNAGAMKRLTAATDGSNVKLVEARTKALELAQGLGEAQHQYRLATSQTRDNTTKTKSYVGAAQQAAQAARQQAEAIQTLTKALQTLINTEISQLQTVDGFKEGLLQLTKQVKDNGNSLSQNTQKGLSNRDALLAILSSAEKAAEGSKNYTKALESNVQQFMAAAKAAGFHKAALQRLLVQAKMTQAQIEKHMTMGTLDTSGIQQSLSAVAADAAIAGHNAGIAFSSAFKRANGIASPSKVFKQYGIWIIQGLVNGMKTLTPKVKSVAHELALGFLTGWKDGTASLKDALSSSVQRVLNKLTDVVDNAITKQQDKLKASRSALQSLLKQRKQDIASLAGTVGQGADLSNLFGTDVNGNPTVANINKFLSGQAKSLHNFAKDLKWGARHGLSPALLAQIAGLGADQGDQVLHEFMSGDASIRQANRAESAIQRYARGAATTAEDAVYAKRVAADRKAVKENTIELRRLTHALHKIERQAARGASTHLTIDAKTGKPQVDKQFTQEIIKAIRRAEREAGKKLL